MKVARLAMAAVLAIGVFVLEAYPQAPGHFEPTGNLTTVRVGHAATVLRDGRVLLSGGSSASAELFDPSTRTFQPTGAMRVSRWSHQAVLLNDGRVLVVGGCACSTVETYDPKTGIFSLTGGPAGEMRYVQSAALLRDGRVLVVSDTSIQIYDPRTGRFTLTNANTGGGSAMLLPDGTVFVGDYTAAQIYNPATDSFLTIRPGKVRSAYVGTPALLLSDGQILFAGGSSDAYGEVAVSTAMIYDSRTGDFQSAGNLNLARDSHTLTLLRDGTVLVAGGYNGVGWDEVTGIFSSAELYDPATKTFALLPEMLRHRDGHTATLLGDGRVLIAGGRTSSARWPVGQDLSAELFVPFHVQETVPLLSMDRADYCVGDSWNLRVEGSLQATGVTLMGNSDGVPWTMPSWRTSESDGTLQATGLFDASAVGNHLLWVMAGGKVSRVVEVTISACPIALRVDSAFQMGSSWQLRISGANADSVVTLKGRSNGVAWEIPDWAKTLSDGSLLESGVFAPGAEGSHELQVRIENELSPVFQFIVRP